MLGRTLAALLVVLPAATAGSAEPATSAPASIPALSLPPVRTGDLDAAHRQAAQELINGGLRYLLSQREADGGWSLGKGANKPALTAMVLKALLRHPDFPADSPLVQQGFRVLLSYRQQDGGIYDPREGVPNYTTSLAVMALAAAGEARQADEIRRCVEFLKGQQILPGSETPDGQKVTEDHPYAGGVSYGKHGRPDLSNVGMWLSAMEEAGVRGDDPAVQRALVFVSRAQNRSESNPLAWAKAGTNDGGFIYAPAVRGSAAEGQSMAASQPGEPGLRSYGSMTYVGFKSLLYAGLAKDDPRVRAAFDWIRRYWRLDSNPNMPQVVSRQGLFYYYHAFAKALRAWGEPVITDLQGGKHNWREELIDALAKQVHADGSWANDAPRWEEGSLVLATVYAVLALEEALEK